ncbi:MAG: N-acetyltransferase family protein [Actinomycetota bacterium]
MIEIRKCDAADESIAPLIDDHCQRAREQAAEFRGKHPQRIAGGTRHVYVAVVGESAVGSLIVHLRDAEEWTIDLVHVLHEARGIGVGDALMKRLMADASVSGVARVSSVALPGDRSTKNLFERFGLIAEAIVVSKDLLS